MNEQNFHPYVSQPPAEPEATPAVPVQPEAPPPFPQADQQAYQYQPPQLVQPEMQGQTQYQPPAEPETPPVAPVQPEASPFSQPDQQTAYQYQPPQPVQPYMQGQTQYQQPYQPPYQQPPYQPPVYAPAPVYVPEQIKGWNWGAFALSWIWGVGNRTYIALLALVPGFSLI